MGECLGWTEDGSFPEPAAAAVATNSQYHRGSLPGGILEVDFFIRLDMWLCLWTGLGVLQRPPTTPSPAGGELPVTMSQPLSSSLGLENWYLLHLKVVILTGNDHQSLWFWACASYELSMLRWLAQPSRLFGPVRSLSLRRGANFEIPRATFSALWACKIVLVDGHGDLVRGSWQGCLLQKTCAEILCLL